MYVNDGVAKCFVRFTSTLQPITIANIPTTRQDEITWRFQKKGLLQPNRTLVLVRTPLRISNRASQ